MGHSSLVAAFGIPHNPHFPTWVASEHPLAAEIEACYRPMREAFERARPDTLIYITSDHYNMFWETLPVFAIGAADSARGASDYPELERELRIDAGLARHIHRHLVENEFDVALLQELAFDHTVIAPLYFLAPETDVALVPIYVNAFIRPLPSARRCLALGRAIAAALQSAPDRGGRVAVAASGSFSLEIGGPRISEDSHTGVPDPRWLDRVLEHLRAADVDHLVAEATDEQLWQAGNAGGEVLDWITLLGTFEPRAPDHLAVQRQFGHAFASWSLDGAGAPA
jgi:aromatic ring-opening dioxygenase catalytic subunit (LigB family)